MRKQYDLYGKSTPEGGFTNPQDFFKNMFGGDLFAGIIGESFLGKFFSSMMDEEIEKYEQQAQGEVVDVEQEKKRKIISEERMQKLKDEQVENVNELYENLVKKTSLYTLGNYTQKEFEEYITIEAKKLVEESYGVELLDSIGYVYVAKAKQYFAKNSMLGVTSVFHIMKEKSHIVGQVFSTVGAIRGLCKEMETKAKIENEQVKGQEGQDEVPPVDFDMETLQKVMWKGSNLMIESTLREVCEAFFKYDSLQDKIERDKQKAASLEALKTAGASSSSLRKTTSSSSLPIKKANKELMWKRAEALKTIGSIYRQISRQKRLNMKDAITSAPPSNHEVAVVQ